MSGHGKTNGGRKFRVKLRAFGCSQTRISPGGETARAMKSETRKNLWHRHGWNGRPTKRLDRRVASSVSPGLCRSAGSTLSRGTEGSNPSCSNGESAANLTSSIRSPKIPADRVWAVRCRRRGHLILAGKISGPNLRQCEFCAPYPDLVSVAMAARH